MAAQEGSVASSFDFWPAGPARHPGDPPDLQVRLGASSGPGAGSRSELPLSTSENNTDVPGHRGGISRTSQDSDGNPFDAVPLVVNTNAFHKPIDIPFVFSQNHDCGFHLRGDLASTVRPFSLPRVQNLFSQENQFKAGNLYSGPWPLPLFRLWLGL
jgi:hypothetical protein